MIFSLRQLQEKCKEQNMDWYMVLDDLTKAFDTVCREGLWIILKRIGCMDKFVNIMRSLHDGMYACVIDGGEQSAVYGVCNGTKQGWFLAPSLFSIVFPVMLQVALTNLDRGISIQFCTDGSVFNLQRLKAYTKTTNRLITDLLCADDFALLAHTLDDIQHIVDCFSDAARSFSIDNQSEDDRSDPAAETTVAIRGTICSS